jgi:hypothetical protein
MQIARKDWRRAERNLKDRDAEAAGFFLQQAGYYLAERYPPLSALELSSADIRKDLKEAREFVKLMFPAERFPLQRK